MVKEKVEEDYKKIKEDYKAKEIEQICAHGVEAARKFQIYQCCLDWADKLEKIPLLSKDILENHNLIEAVYAAEDPKGDANGSSSSGWRARWKRRESILPPMRTFWQGVLGAFP